MYELPEKEQAFLKNKKKQLLYSKDENIFKQGAFAPYVIYVQEGLVKVYLQTGQNKKINISIAKAGDFLAFSSVFGEEVYTYSSVALKDTRVCMIEKERLKELLFKNNDFAMRITSENYKNEKHLLRIIKNISYKQMRGKMASALIYLSNDAFLAEDIYHYLTRQDIADFASISTESAIKFLKEFEKDGLIELNGKEISILTYEEMLSVARNG